MTRWSHVRRTSSRFCSSSSPKWIEVVRIGVRLSRPAPWAPIDETQKVPKLWQRRRSREIQRAPEGDFPREERQVPHPQRAQMRAERLERFFLVAADDLLDLGDRAVLGGPDQAVDHDLFDGRLAFDVERGDAVRMFVDPRPGKFQVGAAKLGKVAADHAVRLGEESAPARSGHRDLAGRGDWSQVHPAVGADGRDLRAFVHELGHETPIGSDR